MGEIDQSKKIQKERLGYYRLGVMPGGHKEGGWLHEGGYKVLGDMEQQKMRETGGSERPPLLFFNTLAATPNRRAQAPDDRKAKPIRGAGSQPEPSPMAS